MGHFRIAWIMQSFHLAIYIYVCIFIPPSIHLSICSCIHHHSYIHPFIYLSIHSYIHSFVPSIHSSSRLSHPFIHPFIPFHIPQTRSPLQTRKNQQKVFFPYLINPFLIGGQYLMKISIHYLKDGVEELTTKLESHILKS